MTMVDIRYRFPNIAKSNKKTHHGKQNTSSRMLYVVPRQNIDHFFCVAKLDNLQPKIYCFEVWEGTILVFPCDCVAVLHPSERSEPLFEQHNPNSP